MTNRSEVMKEAWDYRKSGKTWSESLKLAWASYGMDFGAFAVSAPVKKLPLVLDLHDKADFGKYMGMLAREQATGCQYSFSVA